VGGQVGVAQVLGGELLHGLEDAEHDGAAARGVGGEEAVVAVGDVDGGFHVDRVGGKVGEGHSAVGGLDQVDHGFGWGSSVGAGETLGKAELTEFPFVKHIDPFICDLLEGAWGELTVIDPRMVGFTHLAYRFLVIVSPSWRSVPGKLCKRMPPCFELKTYH